MFTDAADKSDTAVVCSVSTKISSNAADLPAGDTVPHLQKRDDKSSITTNSFPFKCLPIYHSLIILPFDAKRSCQYGDCALQTAMGQGLAPEAEMLTI
jgi:hypothetical protein